MQINLKAVFLDTLPEIRIEHTFVLDEEVFGENSENSTVKVLGFAENKFGAVILNFKVSFKRVSPCDRCLEKTEKVYSLEFSHQLKDASEETDENTEALIINDYTLDLEETVVSDILLELPMLYFCSDDCKGLCSGCGKNLNDGACNCTSGELDPRLSKLKEFLK